MQHLIAEEMETLLRDEVRDPVLRDLALVAVDLSVDYRNVRVVLTGPLPTVVAVREAEAALSRASGFLRTRLSQALDLKRVPQLSFRCLAAGG